MDLILNNMLSGINKSLIIVALLLWISISLSLAGPDLNLSGAGWSQYGVIQKSSDTANGLDLSGRGLLSSGALFKINGKANDRLNINVGIGAVAVHSVLGDSVLAGGYAPMGVYPFVDEANATLSLITEGNKNLYLKAGLFMLDYAPDVRNLGYYLLRGPVYPGIIYSGFESKVNTKSLGIQGHFDIGGFSQDLIINSEADLFPLFDISTAYIAGYGKKDVFNVYAGVNFYRWLSVEDTLTNQLWIGEDTTFLPDSSISQLDTTYLSYSGTKLAIGGSLDLKSIFGGGDLLGPNDLKIYGELAVIGLDDTPVHNRIYGGLGERMPYMIGVNLPGFKFLDVISLELEWYKSKVSDDMTRYNPSNSSFPSVLPVENSEFKNKDDFKWSLYISKVIQNHIALIGQVANDHYRPGVFKGYGDNNPSSKQAVTIAGGDWYWMTKIAYFF